MSTGEPNKLPDKIGCGHQDPDANKPLILTHPKVEPVGTKTSGCGHKPDIDTRTDTAHGPTPDVEINKQSPGCGKPTQTAQELADQLILKAQKMVI